LTLPTATESKDVILEVCNLSKYYPVNQSFFSGKKALLHAVDNVSFQVNRGEVLGLVGESGCGKTTTGRLIVRLATRRPDAFS